MHITREMKKYSRRRQQKHRALVCKYIARVLRDFPDIPDLAQRGEHHDESKETKEEYKPYVQINWMYKLRAEGLPTHKETAEMREATYHHIRHNRHHPEYFDKDCILAVDRDKPSDRLTDARGMSNTDLAEMVCDWAAVAEERGTKLIDWADANIGKRWLFTNEQVNDIYRFIDSCNKK